MNEDKAIALKLLKELVDAKTTIIGEFSGDFEKSKEALKTETLTWLKALGVEETMFDEMVKGNWLFTNWEEDDG